PPTAERSRPPSPAVRARERGGAPPCGTGTGEPNRADMRHSDGPGSPWWIGERAMRCRGLKALLVVGVLAFVACPLPGASAATSGRRTYPLPSDGWKPGQAAMTALFS